MGTAHRCGHPGGWADCGTAQNKFENVGENSTVMGKLHLGSNANLINPFINLTVHHIMLRTKQILQLLSEGKSQKKACRAVKCSKRKVSEVAKIASDSRMGYMELMMLPDPEFIKLFGLEKAPSADEERKAELERLMPDILDVLRRRHATVQMAYDECYLKKASNPYKYTQFKAYVREQRKKTDVSYHNVYEPGKEWQIDFAGDPLYLTDSRTGVRQKLVVLVCVMPFSNFPFMMALPKATTDWFFLGLNKGLEHMGALPAVAKSDNMRQWVTKSDRYSPTFSEAAMEWALHYGIEPTACRVRSPRDKGSIEGFVNVAYRCIYSRLEGELFETLDAINSRIWELLDELCDNPYKGSSRRQIFEEFEKPLMQPLPPYMYRMQLRKEVKLGSTYHICIGAERHFYSVPFKYVGQKVKVMWDAESVDVYVGGERVCSHPRSIVPYGYTTSPAHMPEKHQAFQERREANAATLLDRADRIGPWVRKAIDRMLTTTTFPQQAYGRCSGVLSLGKKYGHARLDNACRIMLEQTGGANYKALDNMLRNKMDLVKPEPAGLSCTEANTQVRGASYYANLHASFRDSKQRKEGRNG